MRVLVLGAGGIVGQHMLLTDRYQSTFWRCRDAGQRKDGTYVWPGVDLTDWDEAKHRLDHLAPEVIVNLAGENRVDVVERDPAGVRFLNEIVPNRLGQWCDDHGAHLIQASTQGVFGGDRAPYDPSSPPAPITAYGEQKAVVERYLCNYRTNWTIARLTFVLGVRPFGGVGRANPLESMFADAEQVQVDDRWFSPLFAFQAATELWSLVGERPPREIVHLGTPIRVSRYMVAGAVTHATFRDPAAHRIHPVSHAYFTGIAPRPEDTTWAPPTRGATSLDDGILTAHTTWRSRQTMDITTRAREISLYLNIPLAEVANRLAEGFHAAHAAVAEDFRAAAPANDDELLQWYATTEAYIWELSAYHLDPGFNYAGMCEGIVNHLTAARARRVLVLGDGIGDVTIALAKAGLAPTYHDLLGSATAGFAAFRFNLELPADNRPEMLLSVGWDPGFPSETAVPAGSFDAVVALDFFEHLTDVEAWATATAQVLRPGGLLLAQNAFACGDDETESAGLHGGSIPMHLSRNNRFATDWDPMLESLGLERAEGGWWRKPVGLSVVADDVQFDMPLDVSLPTLHEVRLAALPDPGGSL